MIESRVIFSVKEVAKRLRVDPQTVYRMVRSRKIPFFRVGQREGGIRFDSIVIEDWIKKQEKGE